MPSLSSKLRMTTSAFDPKIGLLYSSHRAPSWPVAILLPTPSDVFLAEDLFVAKAIMRIRFTYFGSSVLSCVLLTTCGVADAPVAGTGHDGHDHGTWSRVITEPIPASTKTANDSGIKFWPAPSPTVYRFAKISTGAYFYTGGDVEAETIIKNYPDFRFEGHAFAKQVEGDSVPVYRFANLNNGGYFYTASQEERDSIIANLPHFRFEGSTFSVAAKTLEYAHPVYRLANLNNGAYLYTQSAEERDYAVSLGMWRSEGTTFSAEVAVPNGYSVVTKNV